MRRRPPADSFGDDRDHSPLVSPVTTEKKAAGLFWLL
jgi:hypothetical protein